ncbi:phosphatase PAP2 family protein [Streptomyces oryzae]|uniref:Phosphatase PAP2 family protein n=1 Tax=Streptomyces oryzae TaxID=1434886 RepID=A0ABS3XJJ1_9ACTN|nr:phosphatase PAP2 family protein [Streptomyces oryzae]MBO8195544.1 phosphatase PAP2 family protein [Streptomyces oryzae]
MSGQFPPESPEATAVGEAPDAVDPRGLLKHLAPVQVPVPAGSSARWDGGRRGAGPRARLLPPGAALVAGLLLFAVTSYLVFWAGAGFVDRPVLREAVQHRSAALNGPVAYVSRLPELLPLLVAVVPALWLSWRDRSWRPSVLIAGTGTLAVAAATVAKDVADRARPPAKLWAVQESGSCYPSRHTVIATAVLLILAYVLATRTASRAARLLAWSGAVVLSLLAGACRVYLGVHWPTDVIAGLALGAAVALLAVMADTLGARHRSPG